MPGPSPTPPHQQWVDGSCASRRHAPRAGRPGAATNGVKFIVSVWVRAIGRRRSSRELFLVCTMYKQVGPLLAQPTATLSPRPVPRCSMWSLVWPPLHCIEIGLVKLMVFLKRYRKVKGNVLMLGVCTTLERNIPSPFLNLRYFGWLKFWCA
jgi:hypothetical protein